MEIINWIKKPQDTYYFFMYSTYDNDAHTSISKTPKSASYLQSYAGLPDNWNDEECRIIAWRTNGSGKYYSIHTDGTTTDVLKPESTGDAMVQLEKWIYQVEEGKISQIEIHIYNTGDNQYIVYGRKQI